MAPAALARQRRLDAAAKALPEHTVINAGAESAPRMSRRRALVFCGLGRSGWSMKISVGSGAHTDWIMAFTSLAVPPRIGGSVREICTRCGQLGIRAADLSPTVAGGLGHRGLWRPFAQPLKAGERECSANPTKMSGIRQTNNLSRRGVRVS